MADNWQDPTTVNANGAATSTWANQRRDNETALKLATEGDESGTVTHKHKSGLLADRPAAGGAGRIYVATDAGGKRAFFDDGSVWWEVTLLEEDSGAPLLIPEHQSGRWYQPAGSWIPDNTNVGANAGWLYGVPFSVPTTTTYDRIAVSRISDAPSGGNVRMGIYADSAGLPDALVLDAGTVAVSAGGQAEITINEQLEGPKKYWLAAMFDLGDIRFWTLRSVIGSALSPDTIGGAYINVFRSDTTYGALPDPFGSVDGYGTGTQDNVAMALRVA